MPDNVYVMSFILNIFFMIVAAYFVRKKGGILYIRNKIAGLGKGRPAARDNGILPQVDLPYYFERKTLFEVLPPERREIVFLGDSITEHCEWFELFGNPKVKNRGIGGDTTEGILNRIDRILEYEPEKIFLMVGANDLIRGRTVTEIRDNYEKIIRTVGSYSKDIRIIVQSVLPVNTQMPNGKAFEKIKIQQLNKGIKTLARKYGADYINLYDMLRLKDEHELNPLYTYDGIHLNGEGYRTWKLAIEAYFGSEARSNAGRGVM